MNQIYMNVDCEHMAENTNVKIKYAIVLAIASLHV